MSEIAGDGTLGISLVILLAWLACYIAAQCIDWSEELWKWAVKREALRKPGGADVEAAKEKYLRRWIHRRCGGNPVAYVAGALGCTACKEIYPVPNKEPLGETMRRLEKVFKEK
jgi:hypothetical protein